MIERRVCSRCTLHVSKLASIDRWVNDNVQQQSAGELMKLGIRTDAIAVVDLVDRHYGQQSFDRICLGRTESLATTSETTFQ